MLQFFQQIQIIYAIKKKPYCIQFSVTDVVGTGPPSREWVIGERALEWLCWRHGACWDAGQLAGAVGPSGSAGSAAGEGSLQEGRQWVLRACGFHHALWWVSVLWVVFLTS